MVALRGCTPLLECFTEEIESAFLTSVSAWILSTLQFLVHTQDLLSIQLLFRPSCEHLNVLVQTQPTVASSILAYDIPFMLQLHMT